MDQHQDEVASIAREIQRKVCKISEGSNATDVSLLVERRIKLTYERANLAALSGRYSKP